MTSGNINILQIDGSRLDTNRTSLTGRNTQIRTYNCQIRQIETCAIGYSKGTLIVS